MADFNAFKDKLLAKIGQAADGAKDIAEKAADKAKAGGRIAKLSMEIATERDNMKKTYIEIGKLYYDTHKDDPDGFFIQLCEEIALAEKNIAEKETEMAELKASIKDEGEDDSIEVEFEEIVDQDEAAADCGCCCEKAEEAVEEVVEEVKETVEEAVEDAE